MCESTVYLKSGEGEELVMEDAASVSQGGGKVLIENILGEQKEIEGEILEVNLTMHKITIAGKGTQ